MPNHSGNILNNSRRYVHLPSWKVKGSLNKFSIVVGTSSTTAEDISIYHLERLKVILVNAQLEWGHPQQQQEICPSTILTGSKSTQKMLICSGKIITNSIRYFNIPPWKVNNSLNKCQIKAGTSSLTAGDISVYHLERLMVHLTNAQSYREHPQQ